MSENTTHESPAYEKRGYLNHEFRLFHLRGQMDTPVAYHYHDFHKVLILLNGEADYIVEGRSYHLRPLDIVLVGAHCLHKPVVPYKSRYERIILYLSPECLDAFSCADCALDLCFQLAREQQSDVLRLGSLTMTPLLEALSRLENAYQAGGTNDNGTDNANFESLGGSSVMDPSFFCVYYSWNLWYTLIAPPPKTIGNTFRPPLPAKKSWNSCATSLNTQKKTTPSTSSPPAFT